MATIKKDIEDDSKVLSKGIYPKSNIYTKTGDKGLTSLYNGKRIPKDSDYIDTVGTVDELMSFLGHVLEYKLPMYRYNEPAALFNDYMVLLKESMDFLESNIVNVLFEIGSHVATPLTLSSSAQLEKTKFNSKYITLVENEMDRIDHHLPKLTSFVLPLGSDVSSRIHMCRSICRRAERCLIPLIKRKDADENILIFFNRLSDYLFILSRLSYYAYNSTIKDEIIYDKNVKVPSSVFDIKPDEMVSNCRKHLFKNKELKLQDKLITFAILQYWHLPKIVSRTYIFEEKDYDSKSIESELNIDPAYIHKISNNKQLYQRLILLNRIRVKGGQIIINNKLLTEDLLYDSTDVHELLNELLRNEWNVVVIDDTNKEELFIQRQYSCVGGSTGRPEIYQMSRHRFDVYMLYILIISLINKNNVKDSEICDMLEKSTDRTLTNENSVLTSKTMAAIRNTLNTILKNFPKIHKHIMDDLIKKNKLYEIGKFLTETTYVNNGDFNSENYKYITV